MTNVLADTAPPAQKLAAGRNIEFEKVDCPGCGGDDPVQIAETCDYETEFDLTFAVQQCRRCGLAYTSPRPIFEHLLEVFYGETYLCYHSSSLLHRARAALLGRSHLNLLQKYVPPKGRFLDVGCATGTMLHYLKHRTDWDLYGCEPKTIVAEIARTHGLNVVPYTLRDAGFDADYFDVVYMSHVIEHLPDLNETVVEVFRVLKPGGVFITENPDFGGATRSFFKESWWGYHLPRHLTHFTPESLTRFLERHGFEAIHIEPCFRPSLLAWSVQNWVKSKGWPPIARKILGQGNPVFVAAMFPIEYVLLKKGRTDVIKAIAGKPL